MSKQTLEEKIEAAFDVYDKFEKDLSRARDYNETYSQKMRKLMKEQAVRDNEKYVFLNNKSIFTDITGLGPSTYHRIMAIDDYVPSLATFMTLCMVYDLDLAMAVTLRETLGLRFSKTDRLHMAYCYLLVNCRGKSLSYCNKVLQALKIEKKYFLGDGEIDETALIEELNIS